MELPAAFEKRMQDMLGAEYTSFRASYNEPHKRGIRLNTVKCTKEQLERALPFTLVQTPFSPLSFYAPTDTKMAALPLYHAGAFYSQEPSASSAVTLLAPEPGDKVLDLCAAPGGKSTQIAALTGDTGLLWSNEVVRNRAAILSSNLERMGVRNTVVSSVYPEMLAEKLGGYFDKVLVDAPCSGEGMFRRDPVAVQEWRPALYASSQFYPPPHSACAKAAFWCTLPAHSPRKKMRALCRNFSKGTRNSCSKSRMSHLVARPMT